MAHITNLGQKVTPRDSNNLGVLQANKISPAQFLEAHYQNHMILQPKSNPRNI